MDKLTISIILVLSALKCLGGDFAGQWKGVLNLGSQRLNVATDFKEDNGKLTGDFYSLDQAKVPIPITSIEQEGKRIEFKIAPLNISFKGILDGDKIRGKFAQNGAVIKLILNKQSALQDLSGKKIALSMPEDLFESLQGKWNSSLKVGASAAMRLELLFDKNKKGETEIFLISPDQSPIKIPASSLAAKSENFILEFESIGVKLCCKFKNKRISADFQQGNFKAKIKFSPEK